MGFLSSFAQDLMKEGEMEKEMNREQESKTVGGVHAATRTDATRVWDKIKATSAAGRGEGRRLRARR